MSWAEVLRHEDIYDEDDAEDLDSAMWVVGILAPTSVPSLPHDVLFGDTSSYTTCRDEARRLRAAGDTGLRAPSAAVLSGAAETFGVDSTGEHVTGTVPAEAFVVWGPPPVEGMPIGHGAPDPGVLADVRHL